MDIDSYLEIILQIKKERFLNGFPYPKQRNFSHGKGFEP